MLLSCLYQKSTVISPPGFTAFASCIGPVAFETSLQRASLYLQEEGALERGRESLRTRPEQEGLPGRRKEHLVSRQ